MLNLTVIKSEMEANGFKVINIESEATNVINLLRITMESIEETGENGVILVYTKRFEKNKIFIKVEEKGGFTDETYEKIDEIIKRAIHETPENKLPFLFNSILMVSDVTKMPIIVDCGIVSSRQKLSNILKNMDEKVNEDEICFLNLIIPKNTYDEVISELFLASNVLYEMKETDTHSTFYFYRFSESMIEEKNGLEKIQRIMEEKGLPVEISNCYATPLFADTYNRVNKVS